MQIFALRRGLWSRISTRARYGEGEPRPGEVLTITFELDRQLLMALLQKAYEQG
jgi:predicted 3-demethylubiquinone-9 3-methyltransferase (glyoxalase superfamily)